MDSPYPLRAIRALALQAAGLTRPNQTDSPPSRAALLEAARSLGAVQIDTLQRVARAQYVTLWARLGNFDPQLLDSLAYDPAEKQLFEGWYHAACYLPLEEYRYQMPDQRKMAQNPSAGYARWLAQEKNDSMVRQVRARIQSEGALRLSDFERGEQAPGSWWNWRPAKVALEYLFSCGELMISRRVRFQREYDLRERVLPPWVNTSEPSPEERNRFWVERGARALGVCYPRNTGDYTWMRLRQSRPAVEELLRNGILREVQAETLRGVETLLVHRDNLPALQQAAEGEIRAERTAFLTPFDNLWWAQGRDEAFWGFRQRIEAYTPAEKRVYGYFSLPILHKDRLVGRFDPKLERKTATLRLQALHLEPGIAPSEDLVADVAVALRSFMRFHGATDLRIEKSLPPEAGERLLQAM